jgi:transcription-repair coupling factor (superfamily II helicase)
MSKIANLIRFLPTVLNARVLDMLESKKTFSVSGSANHSSKVFTVIDALRDLKKIHGGVWIVNNLQEADAVMRDLSIWSDFRVRVFDSKLDVVAASKVDRLRKMKVMELLAELRAEEKRFLVLPYFELLKRGPDLDWVERAKIVLEKGKEINLMNFYESLIATGYELSEDLYLAKGSYFRTGDTLTIFPVNLDNPVRINLGFDKVESLEAFEQESLDKETIESLKKLEIWPVLFEEGAQMLVDSFRKDNLIVEDDLEIYDEFYEDWNASFNEVYNKNQVLSFVTFNEDESNHIHLHYLSVLKYRGAYDLVNDLKEKVKESWHVIIFTKRKKEIEEILNENNLTYNEDLGQLGYGHYRLFLVEGDKDDNLPYAFQNPEIKLSVISDRDISSLQEEKKRAVNQKVFMDFLASLKTGDYVVHVDHGIGLFLGLEQRQIDELTKEYLKIGYAENDKLFVPIDQADKVNKFIGADENPPKLTRLGSAEWNSITKKVKKETEQIAKELLSIYAERKSASGFAFKYFEKEMKRFEESFEYEDTPGQMRSTKDTLDDMCRDIPMDRLVCGDVGFGKTEVAMRAAYLAFLNKKQTALVSPITILADQHYRSFKNRMDQFNVRVEMLSRFRSHSEQLKILEKLAKGEIDIIIGTHRLLQKDIKFKDLGVVIVDEEQRFGVKQKEVFKKIKADVDFLTLTATPIPRTLNIALNKLRDISTITTPPPGRLPIVTEVRRFSLGLVREAILNEVKRQGQVYFLHNRVQTIDSLAEKLRILVPEARFGVAHGQLGSGDLEERIVAFKDHQFDVLVSSTIIENGIDLANANTLIVNNAEKFGLAQLYQLRGRVGRSKRQAYAYFMYHGQRLKLDAKKRLKAIVEASELGSGFQIAMKDLEIRGAGDILGAKQHGVINVVGVSHFIRMLNKAVEDLKAGRVMREEEPEDISVEIPISAFIPDHYITNTKEKVAVYQKLSAADSLEYLNDMKEEMVADFGTIPSEVINFFKVIEMKLNAKAAGVVGVKAESVYLTKDKEIILHMSNLVKPENIMNLLEYNHKWMISGNKLKIKLEDLGFQWVDELNACLKKLACKVKVS